MSSETQFFSPFSVIEENGTAHSMDSLQQVIRFCGLEWRSRSQNVFSVVPHFSPTEDYSGITVTTPPQRVVIRDFFGQIISQDFLEKVASEARTLWIETRFAARRAKTQSLIEKGLPIPRTGQFLRHGRTLRRPKHLALYKEKVAIQATKTEENLPLTNKTHRPPNAWDDILMAHRGERNWKRYRKTKWRIPAISCRVLNTLDAEP
jgi:hypothetical protein